MSAAYSTETEQKIYSYLSYSLYFISLCGTTYVRPTPLHTHCDSAHLRRISSLQIDGQFAENIKP